MRRVLRTDWVSRALAARRHAAGMRGDLGKIGEEQVLGGAEVFGAPLTEGLSVDEEIAERVKARRST